MRSKQPATTIQDVARAAGVSVTTASRVLNNKDDVAPETYDKVRRVMDELHFSANLAAKSLRSRRTHVIGLLVPEVTDDFNREIITGVGIGIRGSGYDLLIYTRERPALSGPGSWEQEHVSVLSSGLADGCIVVTPSAPSFPPSTRLVVIDPQGDGANIPSVVARNRFGALAVMEYLLNLEHRRIGFIGGRSDTLSAQRRLEGYRDALTAASVPLDCELIRDGDYTRERGRQAAHELLSLPQRPTAIFAANDQTAFGVMDTAQELNLRIPEDISLVGFDNLPEAAQVTPKLTTVDQSIREMGTLATTMLLTLLRGEALEQTHVRVPTRLIVRASCLVPAVS